MPRIRTIKPQFWEDETIGALSFGARLLFIATWNAADDEGRLRWTAPYLKALAFMYDDMVIPDDVRRWMDELETLGLVAPYQHGREKLAEVVNFNQHQVISRPSAWRLPPPPDPTHGVLTEDSLSTHGSLTSGKGKGKDKNPPTPRQQGTNPRALGTNPRAQGTDPRTRGTNPRAAGGGLPTATLADGTPLTVHTSAPPETP